MPVTKPWITLNNAASPQNFIHLHQVDVKFENVTTYNEHPTSKHNARVDFFSVALPLW